MPKKHTVIIVGALALIFFSFDALAQTPPTSISAQILPTLISGTFQQPNILGIVPSAQNTTFDIGSNAVRALAGLAHVWISSP
jgi:hypothetical protein